MMLYATTEPTLEPERPIRLSIADLGPRFNLGPYRGRHENLRLALAQGGRRTCALPTAVFLNRRGEIRFSTTLVRLRSLSVLPEGVDALLGRSAG
jgi:hypothetical protein